MNARSRLCLLLILALALSSVAFGSAYNAKPKLVVIVVVDQLRGDILERFHDELSPQGFRLLLDHGAWYKNCYYQYVNTETGPGHATIGTGSYTLGHGIMANEWFDSARGRMVTSVEDERTKVLGAAIEGPSASPRKLQTNTLIDELKLATGGKAKAFTVALKDRAAILTGGFSANAAFWIDYISGSWITSNYYMEQAPGWVLDFNKAGNAAKYLNREWKDASGKVLRNTTAAKDPRGRALPYYELVGSTPLANDYTLDFTRALIENEHLGQGPATDLLLVSFSSHDILEHKVGPDSPEEREMILALDRQLAGFFDYLQKRVGVSNLVLALTADHGIAPVVEQASKLRAPATRLEAGFSAKLNSALSSKLGKEARYVRQFAYPKAFLDPAAFAAINMTEADAERAVGEAMVQLGMRGYVTRTQMASGEIPNSVFATQFRNSYSSIAGWYVAAIPAPFTVAGMAGTGHGMPYSYDTHVPLAFYGTAFKPGVYRQEAEPTDLAVTLSSILGINKPAAAQGHVLTDAIVNAVVR